MCTLVRAASQQWMMPYLSSGICHWLIIMCTYTTRDWGLMDRSAHTRIPVLHMDFLPPSWRILHHQAPSLIRPPRWTMLIPNLLFQFIKGSFKLSVSTLSSCVCLSCTGGSTPALIRSALHYWLICTVLLVYMTQCLYDQLDNCDWFITNKIIRQTCFQTSETNWK